MLLNRCKFLKKLNKLEIPMSKNTKIRLIKNISTFLGLVITGSVCNLFLNFKNDNENFILFIILFIASFLISYLVDFLFRNQNMKYDYTSNKSMLIYFAFILILRIFPQFYPSSLLELVYFLIFIFITISIKDFYFEKKLNTPQN